MCFIYYITSATAFGLETNNYISKERMEELSKIILPPSTDCSKKIITKNDDEWASNVKDLKVQIKAENLFKKILKKVRNNSPVIDWKKKSKIKIFVAKRNCWLEGKYRLTGDLIDHLGRIDEIPHSMRINLNNDNISGITKFKLFVPRSRFGKNEIITTLLFRELGFLAPRSALIDLQIGGLKVKAIFQEDINDEFLESSGYHSGLIFEGDESFGISLPISEPKLVNKKLLDSEIYRDVYRTVYPQIGFAYLKSSLLSPYFFPELDSNTFISDPFLSPDYFPEEYRDELVKFHLLSFATNSELGLVKDDHRFFYDTISKKLKPIYYDGHSEVRQPIKRRNVNFSFSEKQREYLIFNLKKIDHKKLKKKLYSLGVQMTIADIEKIIQLVQINISLIKIDPRLKKYKIKVNEIPTHQIINKYSSSLYNNEIIFDKKPTFFWRNSNSSLKICENKKNSYICRENFSKENIHKVIPLVRKDLECWIFNLVGCAKAIGNKKIPENRIYLSGKNKVKFKYSDLELLKTKDLQGVKISASPGINVIINKDSRTISFVNNKNFYGFNHSSDEVRQIIISEGTLKKWKIILDENLNLGYDTSKGRKSKNALTGCLTFHNITLRDMDIISESSNCEDAIHFVRVKGKGVSVKVTDARHDAIDADYSNIVFNHINISLAGSDCVDLSAGNYEIEKIKVKNCFDKGISIGEKAQVNLKKSYVKDSKIGIAVKDGSSLKLENGNFKRTHLCIAAYRKKTEFYGANVEARSLFCDQSPIFKQIGSVINGN